MYKWKIDIDGRLYEGVYASVDAAVFGALRKDGFNSWSTLRAAPEKLLIGVERLPGRHHPGRGCRRLEPLRG